jgi:hypothetical protein
MTAPASLPGAVLILGTDSLAGLESVHKVFLSGENVVCPETRLSDYRLT